MKTIGLSLAILATLAMSARAQAQSSAPKSQTQQVTSNAQGLSDADAKKRLSENVMYIVPPEEKKGFSSRPSAAPPSLRSNGTNTSASAAELDYQTTHSMDQGDSEIALGHGPEAAEIFQKILDKYPGQPRATYGLAVSSALAGRAEAAKSLFEKLSATPASPKAALDPAYVAWSHVYLGRMLEIEGDRNSAVREYKAAVELMDAPEGAHTAGQRGIDHAVNIDEAKAEASAATAVNPEEEAAYGAFASVTTNDTAGIDKKLQLGQDFLTKYPTSLYVEPVNKQLFLTLYAKQDWKSFYATADKLLAANPDDVDVLTLVGWVIPHQYYNRQNADAADKLNKAEVYEKHAIELIPSIQKPDGVADDQFAQVKTERLAQAHSGLGLVYFRTEDFGNAARELQLSVQGASAPDPTDLYTLGVVLHELGRSPESIDAFTKCGQIPGALQVRCQKSAESVRKIQ